MAATNAISIMSEKTHNQYSEIELNSKSKGPIREIAQKPRYSESPREKRNKPQDMRSGNAQMPMAIPKNTVFELGSVAKHAGCADSCVSSDD